MDTFSLSLSIGTYNINKKDAISLSFIVGIFHLIMPLLGLIIAKCINTVFSIDTNLLTGIVFIFITIEMIVDFFDKNEKRFENNLISKILLAFCVSIDSFSVGIGLNGITDFPFLGAVIFMITSMLFTYLGLNVGKYAFKKLGSIAKIIGIIILLTLSAIHLLK